MSIATLSAAGIVYTERREFDLDMDSEVKELFPSETPFLTDLYDRRAETDDPDFKLFEDDSSWRYERLVINKATPGAWSDSGNPGATVSALAVDGLVGLQLDASLEGLVVEIWNTAKTTKKGVAYISAFNTANGEITLKAISNPLVANQQAAALADNDVLEVIGHAAGEGSYSPEALQSQPTVVWNSCAIQRTSIEITKTLAKTALKGTNLEKVRVGKEIERLRVNAMRRHKMRIQKRLLMEARVGGTGANGETFLGHITDKDGRTVRTTMGFIPALERYGITSGDSQNVFTASAAAYTFSDLTRDLDIISQYAVGGVRRAYCGPAAMTYWSTLANAATQGWNIQLSAGQKDTYGNVVRYLETGSLTLELVPLHILRGTPYAGYMLIPDMDNIEYRYFRNDAFHANIKNENGYDGIKDEYFSDMGLALTQIKRHALIKVTA